NAVTLPKWEAEQEQAGGRLGFLAKIAEITGIDPVTGQPTAAQERENALEANRKALNELKESHDAIMKALGEGRLNQYQASFLFPQQVEKFNEQIKMLQTQIQQQNADTNRLRANNATASTVTTPIMVDNPAYAGYQQKVQAIRTDEGSKANRRHWAKTT